MTIFEAILLSFVEGITEFLPISSTGHLLLTANLLNIPQTEFVKTFEICIQFGAICAVILLYFQRLTQSAHLWKHIGVAFIPSGILGFFLYKIIKQIFFTNLLFTISALIVGGIILIMLEQWKRNKQLKTIQQLSTIDAVMIGIGQSLAVVPGVSRSAASIVAGMLVGLSKKDAVEFSFLLAVPTIAIASVFDLSQSYKILNPEDFTLLGIGFFTSFFFAVVAIRFFLQIVNRQSLTFFGVYRIVLGIVFFLFFI